MALSDPADKALDAAADGAFGGVSTIGDISGMSQTVGTNRRAGYTDPLGWALKQAKKGATLQAGEGLLLVKYYEEELARLRSLLAMENDLPPGCEEEE